MRSIMRTMPTVACMAYRFEFTVTKPCPIGCMGGKLGFSIGERVQVVFWTAERCCFTGGSGVGGCSDYPALFSGRFRAVSLIFGRKQT